MEMTCIICDDEENILILEGNAVCAECLFEEYSDAMYLNSLLQLTVPIGHFSQQDIRAEV